MLMLDLTWIGYIEYYHWIFCVGSLTAANWVSFDFNVAYSSRRLAEVTPYKHS